MVDHLYSMQITERFRTLRWFLAWQLTWRVFGIPGCFGERSAALRAR